MLLDYVQTRPEVQGQKIGAIGLSGGGLQVMWLAALDERIDCAVISGYFYGVNDSLLHLSNNCACNYIPHMWEMADMGDVAALLAPRPLLIESARQDGLNGPRGMDNVFEQYAITEQAYELLAAPDRLVGGRVAARIVRRHAPRARTHPGRARRDGRSGHGRGDGGPGRVACRRAHGGGADHTLTCAIGAERRRPVAVATAR